MLVQRVVMPASRRESWTVLGDDAVPIEPVERYLAYLTDIERSPNTVKAYAHDLKDWFVFLAGRCLDWREVRLEDVGEFVAWLRLPLEGRDGRVAVLPSVEHHCGEATVNRKLSAVSAFYQHAARNGVDLGELLTTWQPTGRRGTAWRPFLQHISKGKAQLRIALRATRLRRALDPRASATPSAGNAGRPSLPTPPADTTRPATCPELPHHQPITPYPQPTNQRRCVDSLNPRGMICRTARTAGCGRKQEKQRLPRTRWRHHWHGDPTTFGTPPCPPGSTAG